MKRNYEIDFLKFIFTIVIIVFHSKKLICSTENPLLLPKGYLGVEFFFMVSGYLMMAGILRAEQKGIKQTPVSFVAKKIKSFLPEIVFAFTVSFIVWNTVCRQKRFDNLLIAFIYAVPELMFLRFSGPDFATHFYNGPSWYISAMLVGMFILFPFAKKYKEKFAYYIAPIVTVGLYALITNTSHNGLNVTGDWLLCINGGLARALAGLSLGCTIYYASESIKASKRQLNKAGNITFGVFEVLILVSLYLFMRNKATHSYGAANDVVSIVFFMLLLLLVFSKNYSLDKVFASKPMLSLYKLSLPLFLNQRIVIYFLNEKCTYMSFTQMLLWYLGVTLALSLVSIPASKGLRSLSLYLKDKVTTA